MSSEQNVSNRTRKYPCIWRR